MKIFDTHTHLNDSPFADRLALEVDKARQFGVVKINNVGSNLKLNQLAVEISEKFDECYATIGWHPDDAGEFGADAIKYLRQELSKPKVIALGEIGLDYHWMVQSKEVQEKVFRRQIQISKEMNVPFQVHTRDALEETYQIIKDEGVGPAGAIMHSFSGNVNDAKRFVDLGMMISFSGVITFKKALGEQNAARELPLDRILVETDAPYLTPVPFRGRENTPAYTSFVVKKIAELRNLSEEEVALATYENALSIFKLK
ncbi:TatD family hydrolase [Lactococcus fujiensis]|uniref:Deoxyribonuclease n=1 Tax=Lactococcus fujiensis JCM 16395 TaxID=1291764 RepID=A0A2A5RPC2_9LACT|nr:TatD family hydrolase [Lactococcus fujiensis]PCS01300.1 deoxyribonuclease [Lactococcus fujiensis JCM 16395]